MSNTMKSAGKMNLFTFTSTSSIIPPGYLIDLSASCREKVVGFAYPSPSFLYIERDIRCILAPKLHKALSKNEFSMVQ